MKPAPESPTERRELSSLQRLAYLLDNAIPLPGGYRVGVDGFVSLIPGLGDGLGAFTSTYIVYAAARLGVPTATLLHMVGNVAIDLLIGLVPLIGDLFDFGWKANARNVALIESRMARASRGPAGTRRLAVLIASLVVVLCVAAILAGVWLVSTLVALASG